jgi:hypothetical protein
MSVPFVGGCLHRRPYRPDGSLGHRSRDFVRACQTPILVLPDDVPPHPYAVAMESAMLAPNAQVSLYPWKDVPEKIPLAVRHIRTFLKANRPATAAMEQRAAAD